MSRLALPSAEALSTTKTSRFPASAARTDSRQSQVSAAVLKETMTWVSSDIMVRGPDSASLPRILR